VGRQLDALLAPDEGLYTWGMEPGLYFASGRRPPTGVFLPTQQLSGWPGASAWSARVLADLQVRPPELIAVTGRLPAGHPVRSFVHGHYRQRPVLKDRRGFAFWVRRDGALEARLDAGRAKTHGSAPQ